MIYIYLLMIIVTFSLFIAIYYTIPMKGINKEYDCNISRSEQSGAYCINKKNPNVGWNNILDSGLANEIGRLFKNQTIIDLGAGVGQYCAVISNYTACHPYDGAKNIEIVTNGKVKFLNLAEKIKFNCIHDVVMSIEVGEHIPTEYENTYVDNLIKCSRRIIILTWARIGQDGFSHINNKDKNEVLNLFTSKGLTWNDSIYKQLSTSSRLWYIRDNLMVFSKQNISQIS